MVSLRVCCNVKAYHARILLNWSLAGLTLLMPAGVSDNRLQNVVITLDKVRLCLSRPGEPLPLAVIVLEIWTAAVHMPFHQACHTEVIAGMAGMFQVHYHA